MKHKRAKQKQKTVGQPPRNASNKKVTAKSAETTNMSNNMKIAIFIISLVVLIAGFVAVLSFSNCMKGMNEAPENTLPADEALVPIDPEVGKVNVLVLGLDKGGYRTDTIIVASCDLDNNCVNMLSIPRDTRMYVGGHYQKINSAYAIKQDGKMKGVSGTIEAVTRLTGIPIHHYVVFECNTFREVIDALDGIDFDVPQNMNYDDPVQDLHIHLKKGFQHLDGDKAEQLVRFRRYPTGDIKRVEVQQDFMKALADQKLNPTIIASLPELFNVWTENIRMSFKGDDIIRYSGNLLKLRSENIKAYLLPGVADGEHYGASYWVADMDEVKKLVEGTFGYDASNITIHSSDGKSASKDVKKTTTSQPKPKATEEKTETEEEDDEKPKSGEKDKSDTSDKDKSKSEDKDKPKSEGKDKPKANEEENSDSKNKDTEQKSEDEPKTGESGSKRPVANDED